MGPHHYSLTFYSRMLRWLLQEGCGIQSNLGAGDISGTVGFPPQHFCEGEALSSCMDALSETTTQTHSYCSHSDIYLRGPSLGGVCVAVPALCEKVVVYPTRGSSHMTFSTGIICFAPVSPYGSQKWWCMWGQTHVRQHARCPMVAVM